MVFHLTMFVHGFPMSFHVVYVMFLVVYLCCLGFVFFVFMILSSCEFFSRSSLSLLVSFRHVWSQWL